MLFKKKKEEEELHLTNSQTLPHQLYSDSGPMLEWAILTLLGRIHISGCEYTF